MKPNHVSNDSGSNNGAHITTHIASQGSVCISGKAHVYGAHVSMSSHLFVHHQMQAFYFNMKAKESVNVDLYRAALSVTHTHTLSLKTILYGLAFTCVIQ
jgi:hypothetical protein